VKLSNPDIYVHELTVEFDEVDSYGIVHHARLISYLERARVHYFTAKGIDIKNLPYGFIVYKIEARFITPAYFLDQLRVEVALYDITSSYITFAQRILRKRETIIKAKVTHALSSIKTGKILIIPEELYNILTL
jgi:acyl-CoA thioester hydrolase